MARHHIRTSGQCTGKYDGVSYAKQRWRQPCRDAKFCVSRGKIAAKTSIYSHHFIAQTCVSRLKISALQGIYSPLFIVHTCVSILKNASVAGICSPHFIAQTCL